MISPGSRISFSEPAEVPEVVVQRLPLYVRVLSQFARAGIEVISSEQLGAHLQMTPAQIRKDLSYFGRFGKQGRGYDVRNLAAELRHILGLDVSWNAAVVGMGRLGRAVVAYPGFEPEGFRIVAAFDADDRTVGQQIGTLRVQAMRELEETVKAREIAIGIVTVPSAFAQEVINELVAAGIRSVLNYAPIAPVVPAHVKVRGIDPVLALQSMTYYLKHGPAPSDLEPEEDLATEEDLDADSDL
jgi:redox-sensing transcriptional repressor